MFTPCGKCENGYLYSGEEARLCDCLKTYRARRNMEIKLDRSGLPPRIVDYDIETYIGQLSLPNILKLRYYVSQFETRFHMVPLYFWSRRNSTQKTTVASWIGRELIAQGKTVYMVIMDKLLKDLQDAQFDETEATKQRVEVWLDCDFLIIDDSFDPRKVTVYRSGYQLPFLDNFLRRRMETLGLATCFTSNISITEIGKTFGQSIEALVKRCVADPMEFKDVVTRPNHFNPKELWPHDLLNPGAK